MSSLSIGIGAAAAAAAAIDVSTDEDHCQLSSCISQLQLQCNTFIIMYTIASTLFISDIVHHRSYSFNYWLTSHRRSLPSISWDHHVIYEYSFCKSNNDYLYY